MPMLTYFTFADIHFSVDSYLLFDSDLMQVLSLEISKAQKEYLAVMLRDSQE